MYFFLHGMPFSALQKVMTKAMAFMWLNINFSLLSSLFLCVCFSTASLRRNILPNVPDKSLNDWLLLCMLPQGSVYMSCLV